MTIVFGTEEFESHVLCLYNVKSCLLTIAKKDDYRSKFTSPDNIYGVFLPKHSDLEIDKMHEGYIKVYVIEFLNSSDKKGKFCEYYGVSKNTDSKLITKIAIENLLSTEANLQVLRLQILSIMSVAINRIRVQKNNAN